jgi:5-bromo-4-chloroindolyl phosphate hydrolysis protein
MSGVGRGTAVLVAGIAAAVVLPLLAIVANLPILFSLAVAAAVFGGVWLLLRSGRPANLAAEDLLTAQSDTARALIADGAAALERLRKVIPTINDLAMQTEMRTLAMTAQGVLSDMLANPGRVMSIRRLFTFYLPNAVAVAEGWQMLERHASPSVARVQQSRETMRALNEAFVKYAQDADAPELQELDTTLKLLKSSLKSDMEKIS